MNKLFYASLFALVLLGSALIAPTTHAYAIKADPKHNEKDQKDHQKPRKDSEKDNHSNKNHDKKCKPKKNGKYHKECD